MPAITGPAEPPLTANSTMARIYALTLMDHCSASSTYEKQWDREQFQDDLFLSIITLSPLAVEIGQHRRHCEACVYVCGKNDKN